MQNVPSLYRHFINILIPLRCVKCGDILEDHKGLCPTCWPKISFLSKPHCACCGHPFAFEIEEGALCGACNQTLPPFKTARSVFAYTPESRDLILKFKHTDTISSAPLFAEWMAKKMEGIENPLCIPVPLHRTRLFIRTYNQAALLAKEISRLKGWTYAPTLLFRLKKTPSQGHLTKENRYKNVRGAFKVLKKKRQQLSGQNIVLIDDVYTSGATLKACTKTLLKAGAKEVHALTLGRVVRDI